jgi:hypothetical protein
MSGRILNGWKEISGYIQRSVRTVQRWEAEMGLPVYRPATKESAVVVAFTNELDDWLHGSPVEATPAPTSAERLLEDVDSLVADAAELSSRVRMLQEQLRLLHPQSHRRETARRLHRVASSQALGCLVNFPAPAPDSALIPTHEPQTR